MGNRKIRQLILIPVLAALLLSGCSSPQESNEDQGVIYYVQASPANMLEQIKTGEIDAFVAWEPNNAQAVTTGTGRYLLQSGEISAEHPCCILALVGKDGNEDLALALAWANVQAINFINDPANQEKMVQYAKDFTGRSQDAILEGLTYTKYVDFPDLARFEDFLSGMRENGSLVKEPTDLGYKDDQDFFRAFMNSNYVDQVKTELKKDPTWVPPAVSAENQVILGYINQDLHHLPLHIALQEGYYSRVGLNSGQNLQLKGYANGVAVMEAFKARELTASYLGVAPAVLKQLNDGIAIRGIAGANDEGSAIVVGKDSSIQSVKDLAGKVVAIPGVGTVQGYLLEAAARSNNMRLQVK